MLEFMRLAESLGVSFAFPTQTLHVDTLAQAADAQTQAVFSDDKLKELVEAFGPGGAESRPGGPKLTHGFFPDS